MVRTVWLFSVGVLVAANKARDRGGCFQDSALGTPEIETDKGSVKKLHFYLLRHCESTSNAKQKTDIAKEIETFNTLLAQGQHEVEVTASKPYGSDEKWGVEFLTVSNLKIMGVDEGSWAAKHTNLRDYIGHTLLKVNGFPVTTQEQVVEGKSMNANEHNVVFTLEAMPDVDWLLSKKGHTQAKYIAKYFTHISTSDKTAKNLIPGKIYTSPYIRTLQSVKPLAEALNINPQLELDLHEIGGIICPVEYINKLKQPKEQFPEGYYPQTKGMNFNQMTEIVPTLDLNEQNVSLDAQGWYQMGRVESDVEYIDRAYRIKEWMWELVEDSNPGGNEPAIIIQGHGAIFDRLLKSLLDMPRVDNRLQNTAELECNNGAYWLLELSLKDDPVVAGDEKIRFVEAKLSNAMYHIPEHLRTGGIVNELELQVPNQHELDLQNEQESSSSSTLI